MLPPGFAPGFRPFSTAARKKAALVKISVCLKRG